MHSVPLSIIYWETGPGGRCFFTLFSVSSFALPSSSHRKGPAPPLSGWKLI